MINCHKIHKATQMFQLVNSRILLNQMT